MMLHRKTVGITAAALLIAGAMIGALFTRAESQAPAPSMRYEIANTAEGILVLDRSTSMVYFCGPPRGVLPSEPSYRIKCIGFADLSVLVP